MSETREREKGDAGRFEEEGPASWPANIREFVEDEQERAYWDVAMELGLGPNPTAAYQRVIRPLMPLSQIQATKSAELGKSIVDIYGKYFGHELPTKFEDPNYYPIMLLLLDQVLAAFSTIGRQVPARPFVATMPSGRVNATTRADDATGRSVIIFEHGLFQYLGDFALLVGWSVPPFSDLELSNDNAFARHRGPYTMPFNASANFTAALCAYVTSGTPSGGESVPKPPFNWLLCAALMDKMREFVMAHELAHVALNHIDDSRTDKDSAWAREYDADALAAYLLCQTSSQQGMSWGLTFWACDLALTALDILDRAIGQLQFGSQPSWISRSHPDSYSRRTRLRELITVGEMGGNWRLALRYFLKSVLALIGFGSSYDFRLIRNPPIGQMEQEFAARIPATGYAAASEACGMTDALLGRLWQFAAGLLLVERSKGKHPARVWRKRIAQCFDFR